MNASAPSRHDALSQAFHWITAVVVPVAFILGPERFGRLMRQGVDPATRLDIVWHESLGVLLLVLTVSRLVWVALRPRRQPVAMARWMHVSAKVLHGLLWALLLALPATALLALGSEAHPLTLLGGLRVDRLPMIAGSPLAKLADWGNVHKFLGDAIAWLAGAHAAAAIYHHAVLRDGVLSSMLPGWKSR